MPALLDFLDQGFGGSPPGKHFPIEVLHGTNGPFDVLIALILPRRVDLLHRAA
jgi:hypothetical protein